jgi:hypothetical protein
MTKITWTSKDGAHQLAAWVQIGIGGVVWHASIDGKGEGGGCYGANTQIPAAHRAAGIVAAIGRVALTADRYAVLIAEASILQDQYRNRPESLREQRQNLAADIRGALDDAGHARERAFNRDIGGIPGYEIPAVVAARKALADFDAAHPEIAARIADDKAAAAERNTWN